LLLSRVLLREGRDGAAIGRAVRDILTLDPYHLEARSNLTIFLRQQGREADALARSSESGNPYPVLA
jgi:cytochrome c-type biogenesis protein CcmH/NrfG